MTTGEPSDDEVFAHFPDVLITHDNIAHYRALMGRRLVIDRCGDCGHWIYPHRPLCPACLSWKVAAEEVSGKATLYMYTLIHQSRDPDNPLPEPVLVAAVELAEQPGLRYLSRIADCTGPALAHGMPLKLVWIEEDGRHWPAFAPDAAGGA